MSPATHNCQITVHHRTYYQHSKKLTTTSAILLALWLLTNYCACALKFISAKTNPGDHGFDSWANTPEWRPWHVPAFQKMCESVASELGLHFSMRQQQIDVMYKTVPQRKHFCGLTNGVREVWMLWRVDTFDGQCKLKCTWYWSYVFIPHRLHLSA